LLQSSQHFSQQSLQIVVATTSTFSTGVIGSSLVMISSQECGNFSVALIGDPVAYDADIQVVGAPVAEGQAFKTTEQLICSRRTISVDLPAFIYAPSP
jgi:hypothetical protein